MIKIIDNLLIHFVSKINDSQKKIVAFILKNCKYFITLDLAAQYSKKQH